MNISNTIKEKINVRSIALPVIKLREVLFYAFFLLFMMVKCLYFQYTTQLNIRPYLHIVNIKMYVASGSVLFIIFAIIFILFNKKRFVALLVLDILLSVVLLADAVYFRYYNNPITVPVLMQIGLLGPLGDSIANLIKYKDAILFLDIPLLLAGLIYLHRKGITKSGVVMRLIIGVVLIALGFTSYSVAYKYTQKGAFSFDKNYYAKLLGIFEYHVQDAKNYVKENLLTKRAPSKSEKKLVDDFFSSKKSEGTSFKDIAKGKNIIIVQSEAMQQFLINSSVKGNEITPNLNSLIKDSLYFDNFYYQAAGGKTSDAEFLCQTSLYPVVEGAVYIRFPGNTYHTFPNILQEQGYEVDAFHAYDPSFWNRAVMYRSIGFDNFYSRSDFKMDEKAGWGLSDASLFRQSLDKLQKQNKPFLGFMVTLSSHYPFDEYKDYDFDVGEYQGTFFGNYLKAEHYADKCIGTLIEELKKRNMYDNTLLLIYGDHYGIPKLEGGNELVKFLGIENNNLEWLKLQKVPFIIHYPGLKNGETMNIASGQIDILPTLANLAGFDAPYAMGKDLLNTKDGYAVLRYGSLVTDKFIYSSENTTAYDAKTGAPLEKAQYQKDLDEYRKELTISDIIINRNAFKK